MSTLQIGTTQGRSAPTAIITTIGTRISFAPPAITPATHPTHSFVTNMTNRIFASSHTLLALAFQASQYILAAWVLATFAIFESTTVFTKDGSDHTPITSFHSTRTEDNTRTTRQTIAIRTVIYASFTAMRLTFTHFLSFGYFLTTLAKHDARAANRILVECFSSNSNPALEFRINISIHVRPESDVHKESSAHETVSHSGCVQNKTLAILGVLQNI